VVAELGGLFAALAGLLRIAGARARSPR
jgi:hypothetical protein